MRVLLINPNQEHLPYPVLPSGLCSVASYLESTGFSVKTLDLCFCKDIRSRLKQCLESFDADGICISIRNIDNGEYLATKYYLPQVRYIIDCCRQLSKSPIFIGGPAVNIMPKTIKGYIGADFAVLGDLNDGAGLLKWINIKDYLACGASVPIQTKKGCQFNCIYCSYKNIEGSQLRLKDPEAVADEIEAIRENSGARDFEFVDSVFNHPESHAKEICRRLIKRNIKANFGVACLNPLSCSEELFVLFKEANFRWLICTPESASGKMLSNLNKGFTIEEVYNTASLVKKFRTPTLWAFLTGAPGETMDTVYKTLDFIDTFIDKKDLAYMTVGLRIYPNTRLAGIALEEGLIKDEEQLIEPTFYFSKELDERELRLALFNFAKTHPNFICSYQTQKPIFQLASRLFYRMGIRQPYWRYAILFNKISRVNKQVASINYQLN